MDPIAKKKLEHAINTRGVTDDDIDFIHSCNCILVFKQEKSQAALAIEAHRHASGFVSAETA